MALLADERRLVGTHSAKVHDFQPSDITTQGFSYVPGLPEPGRNRSVLWHSAALGTGARRGDYRVGAMRSANATMSSW
jgi:hypothetical protein